LDQGEKSEVAMLLVLGLLAFAAVSSWAIHASIPAEELHATVAVQEPHATVQTKMLRRSACNG